MGPWEGWAESKSLRADCLIQCLLQVTLTLTVPEYSNKRVSRPVQVYFYVSNGRRKRSPTQTFKFLPGTLEDSPWWGCGNTGSGGGAEGCSAPMVGGQGWLKPGDGEVVGGCVVGRQPALSPACSPAVPSTQ